ncbi:hypothetical protein C7271_15075 [filamentous cyanobacterium CCP5]|nr:hypothetical protein C7271_15075 [filamentous cyanobacterium CCP5]
MGLVELPGNRLAQAQVPDLPPAYWEAVNDARVAEPNEIYPNLTAITDHNHRLRRDDRDRVLVVTWSGWNGYSQNAGSLLVLTRELWVTVAPDLQQFCRAYHPTATISLAARLNQLLGLPPDSGNRQVIELWVDPQYLFRPSPDPEISDREAELAFRTANPFVTSSPDYQHWFYTQYDQRYQHNGQPVTPISFDGINIPYPWTQLGYTYDWGSAADWQEVSPGRPDHIGLSEFVVQAWSPISVHSAQSAEAYCQ